MQTFEDTPLIHLPKLYRAADVSVTVGDRVVRELEKDKRITPSWTPTGRGYVSPRDGKTVITVLTSR